MRDQHEETMERDVPALLRAAPPPSIGGQVAVAAREASIGSMVMLAQQYPRNTIAARRAITNAFTDPELAAVSQYEYVKGGNEISGASVHAARAMALAWGRMDSGIRILGLGRGPDGIPYTECEAFAFDFETIVRRSIPFVVRHWRSTKRGGYALTDDREIGDLISNIGARRERACILALLPRDVVNEALKQADVTNETKADISESGIQSMVTKFGELGVTQAMIEARIQRPVANITPTQYLALRKVYTSLRDGASRPGQHFEINEEAGSPSASAAVERVRTTTPPPKKESAPAAPAQPDVGDLLRSIKGAQTFEELQDCEDQIGGYGDADRALLVEALKHRDTQLAGASHTDHNGNG